MSRRVSLTALFPVISICLILVLCSAAAAAEKKIGILLFNDQPRYVETQRGIVDYLKRQGFGEPNYVYTIESAKGSKAKVLAIVRKFATEKMALIVAIGTGAAWPAAREIKDVPIVFSMVYDPVETNIARSWKSSGNNTTGTTTKLSMLKVMSVVLELAPVTKMAVLYTPGEKNSEAQLRELQKIQKNINVRILPVILTKGDDAELLLSQVVRTADAIYLTGSSIVGSAVPVIVRVANRAKVITVTHLDDIAEKGALLGISLDSYYVGRMAGLKAARILRGAKPSSIPIETGDKIEVILNMKSARDGQFNIPPAFLKKVTKKIE
jgi:putative tryptophan/tyrosine transport system substrate-binding protein